MHYLCASVLLAVRPSLIKNNKQGICAHEDKTVRLLKCGLGRTEKRPFSLSCPGFVPPCHVQDLNLSHWIYSPAC